jgi:endonuclease/exonuclease/phosphatase (EEP) superfamily protein YafD
MRTSITDRFPAVPALAWRPHLAVVLAVVAVPLTRAVPVAAAVVGVVALVLGLPALWHRRPRRGPAPSPDDLVVLVLNVWLGRADAAALAALVERETPDLVVLPEAGPDYCGKVEPLVAALGYRGTASIRRGLPDGWGVTVLTGPRAAGAVVEPGHAMSLPHVRITGGPLGDRSLYAVHTTAPAELGRVHEWRHDMRVAAGWTAGGAIVAGDVNATLDHRLLRAVGRSAGPVGTGTWPTRLPRWAGIRIDHVLLPADLAASAASVHDVAGSDHRALLVRLPALVRAQEG